VYTTIHGCIASDNATLDGDHRVLCSDNASGSGAAEPGQLNKPKNQPALSFHCHVLPEFRRIYPIVHGRRPLHDLDLSSFNSELVRVGCCRVVFFQNYTDRVGECGNLAGNLEPGT
jgi:hypothetical protein